MTQKYIKEKEQEITCGSCCFSCCDSKCVDTHPIDRDRWCHKLNKSVYELEDATNCKYYFD